MKAIIFIETIETILKKEFQTGDINRVVKLFRSDSFGSLTRNYNTSKPYGYKYGMGHGIINGISEEDRMTNSKFYDMFIDNIIKEAKTSLDYDDPYHNYKEHDNPYLIKGIKVGIDIIDMDQMDGDYNTKEIPIIKETIYLYDVWIDSDRTVQFKYLDPSICRNEKIEELLEE